MIDIENDVFNYVSNAVALAYGDDVYISGEYDDSPASFPAVTIVEADNSVHDRMRTENIENAVNVMYEINVYSNRTAGRKTEAKKISDLIDSLMLEKGFTRIMRNQVPNLANAKIYRIVARYRAVVGPGNQDGSFLIYQNNTL